MFGLIYTIGSLLAAGVSGLKCSYETSEGKQRGIERLERGENPFRVYYDYQGRCRDLDSGQPVSVRTFDSFSIGITIMSGYQFCKDGDKVVVTSPGGHVLRRIPADDPQLKRLHDLYFGK